MVYLRYAALLLRRKRTCNWMTKMTPKAENFKCRIILYSFGHRIEPKTFGCLAPFVRPCFSIGWKQNDFLVLLFCHRARSIFPCSRHIWHLTQAASHWDQRVGDIEEKTAHKHLAWNYLARSILPLIFYLLQAVPHQNSVQHCCTAMNCSFFY